MTLRRRMMLHTGATAVGALTVCVIMALEVAALRQDFGIALQANRQLRRVYEVGVDVASARRWVAEEPAARPGRHGPETRRARARTDGESARPRAGTGAGRRDSLHSTSGTAGAVADSSEPSPLVLPRAPGPSGSLPPTPDIPLLESGEHEPAWPEHALPAEATDPTDDAIIGLPAGEAPAPLFSGARPPGATAGTGPADATGRPSRR